MKQQILRGVELVAVGQASLLRAQQLITGCAVCSKSASRTFEAVIAETLGNSCGSSEYFVCSLVECPRCASPILEKTLVSVGDCSEAAVEDKDVVFVDERILEEAEGFVVGCEYCEPERAEISFDQILDAVTCCDPTITEYVICRPAKCPHCLHNVMEKTLILAD
jgi:hypothetical protein